MHERHIQILYADMPKKKRLFIMNSLFFERQETQNRPLRVSDNKNIKISLKAQAHFSGFNDCKHTGKYKILYAFSAFVQ